MVRLRGPRTRRARSNRRWHSMSARVWPSVGRRTRAACPMQSPHWWPRVAPLRSCSNLRSSGALKALPQPLVVLRPLVHALCTLRHLRAAPECLPSPRSHAPRTRPSQTTSTRKASQRMASVLARSSTSLTCGMRIRRRSRVLSVALVRVCISQPQRANPTCERCPVEVLRSDQCRTRTLCAGRCQFRGARAPTLWSRTTTGSLA